MAPPVLGFRALQWLHGANHSDQCMPKSTPIPLSSTPVRGPVKFLKDRLPDRTALLQRKWAQPFSAWLSHHGLWQFNRRSVARGVSLGLFFGLLLPFGQILLVAITAIGLRANIPVAVGATFVTNPLTYPPIYFGAAHVGRWILGDAQSAGASEAESSGGWLTGLVDWVSSVGPALGIGLSVFAVSAALLGYIAVHIAWRLAVLRRRRRRA